MGYKVEPAIHSFDEMKRKWDRDNEDKPYERSPEISGWYDLDKWLLRVTDDGTVVGTIGWKEEPEYVLLGGLKGRDDLGHYGNTKALTLDTTGAAATGSEYWNDTDPTSTHFTVKNSNQTGDSGQGYIAYLFAHNDDDGGFGEPGDQDIIKCDTYTGNGSSTGPVVTLGFEPQFIMLKRTDDTENANWYVFDTMRGIVTGGDDPYLYWNTNAAEVAGNAIEVTSTGFQLKTSSSASKSVL